jgi:hypothetical protein
MTEEKAIACSPGASDLQSRPAGMGLTGELAAPCAEASA